jgi:hypothetical protein
VDVTVTDGQRIILEIGESFTAGAQAHTCSISSNINCAAGAADLPVDNTTTTASIPWVEFSQTILMRKVGTIQ